MSTPDPRWPRNKVYEQGTASLGPIGPTQPKGLFAKFHVERLRPSSRGIVHNGCRYFVLDITHDPHALAAALAYADSCEAEYPLLARDLRTETERAA